MGYLFFILIVCVVVILGYILPQKYNADYSAKYGVEPINYFLTGLCSISILFYYFVMDTKSTILYIFALLLMFFVVIVSLLSTYLDVQKTTKSNREALKAVLLMISSIAGIALTILFILASITGSSKRKRK